VCFKDDEVRIVSACVAIALVLTSRGTRFHIGLAILPTYKFTCTRLLFQLSDKRFFECFGPLFSLVQIISLFFQAVVTTPPPAVRPAIVSPQSPDPFSIL